MVPCKHNMDSIVTIVTIAKYQYNMLHHHNYMQECYFRRHTIYHQPIPDEDIQLVLGQGEQDLGLEWGQEKGWERVRDQFYIHIGYSTIVKYRCSKLPHHNYTQECCFRHHKIYHLQNLARHNLLDLVARVQGKVKGMMSPISIISN